jgi:hypothetical protein
VRETAAQMGRGARGQAFAGTRLDLYVVGLSAVGADVAELEFLLDRGAGEGFTVAVRVARPGAEVDDRLEPIALALDREALLEHAQNPAAYGRVLMECLFADPKVRDAFTTARAAATWLRIRLSIGSSAPELHDLQWEALADPHQPELPLFHDPRVLFSRYLSSFSWRTVRLRPRQRLRALVVVANPQNLDDLKLAPVDVELELAHASAGLQDDEGGKIPITIVRSDSKRAPGRAMLERVIEALRDDHDILYLVCHGRIDSRGRANVFLEGADGKVAAVSADQLVQKLVEVEERPRLVVLASCQSSGSSTEASSANSRALLALGPRLAEAGIPAVVAMSGNVPMVTVAEFMPAFFRALTKDGLVDHAMAAGRRAVTRRADASRPVLFMRLRRGRIWYDAGFAGQDTLRSWAGLRRRIDKGQCTPILGPGLLETLFEYRSWLARRWAAQHGFPLAPSQREDLTQVAQHLASMNYPTFPHEQLADDLGKGLRERLGDATPKGSRGVDSLLSKIQMQRSGVRPDPYRILAELPLPVYLSFCPDSLLLRTLAETRVALEVDGQPVQRRPRAATLVWKPALKQLSPPLPNPWEQDPDYEPSPEEPLVYHLFGTLDKPESLVLTQDDYFDFLLNIQKPEVHNDIPPVVRKRLTNSSLLFLGFPLDSWEFRAVFRMIVQQGGGLSLATRPHVAAQVEPEEGRLMDPIAARDLMREAFNRAQVDLYFGTVERFVSDLEQVSRTGA